MELKDYYLNGAIPQDILAMVQLVGNKPTLQAIWALMDLAWAVTEANPNNPQRMAAFYRHPVWTLNGIFTETHKASLDNRLYFSEVISQLKPLRIADYGGGFGALARILAERNPQSIIEVVDPFPSDLAITKSAKYENIVYVDHLTGVYDVIVALDVLEHVEEPLNLIHMLAQHVNKDSRLLLANCFFPVIKCHLPCTFYLRDSFDFLLRRMGICAVSQVLYGALYALSGPVRQPSEIKFWIFLAKLYFMLKEAVRNFKKTVKELLSKR